MKLTCIALAAFCICFSTIAQTPQSDLEVKKIIPATPNAASLGKYGDIPIGLQTGQPNINFPFYEIAYNDLSVPVSLSYNYPGLKVEEYPGWVGSGWNVNGHGVITRQQRSLADESAQGYNGINKNGEKAVDFINSGNVSTFQTYLDGVRNGVKDSEPDVFVFNFPGYSGKFFFDETQCETTVKEAIVIPHQKLKIFGYFNYTAVYNHVPGIIEKFVIVDQKGITFTFDVIEKAASVEPGDPHVEDFASSWYLSSIETPNGNTVSYQYRSRVMDNPATVYERRIVPLSSQQGVFYYGLVTKQFTASATTEVVLEKITFRGGSVEFIEGDTREDWNPLDWAHKKGLTVERPKTLGKIRIKSGSVVAKEIVFSYSYFGTNARLRLDSFYEVSDGETKPPHVFTYKHGAFPTVGDENQLFRQDHWGYYRGGTDNTLLPPYSNAIDDATSGTTIFINVPGNTREPNSNAASAGMLTKITYPTKGYTTFEYEANQYWGSPESGFNLCSGTFQPAGNVHAALEWGDQVDLEQITLTTKSCVKIEYTLQTPCVDGFASILLTDANGRQIVNHAQEKKMTGIQHTDAGPAYGETFVLNPGTYTLSATVINENTCGSGTLALASIHKITQDSAGYANLTAGGLRVAKIKDCVDAQTCITRQYQYHDIENPSQSSGKLINEPVYGYYQDILFSTEFGSTIYETFCANLVANSEVPIATSSGGVVGYKYVTVTEEGDGTKGRTFYRFSTAGEYPDEGHINYPFPPRISNEWKRGLQLSKEDHGIISTGQEKRLTKQGSGFGFNETYNRQIAFKPKKRRDSRTGNYEMTIADFDFEPYTTKLGWASVNTQYDSLSEYPGGAEQVIATSKSIWYENSSHLLPTRIEVIDSKNEVRKTTFKYVQDIGSVTGLTASEISDIQSNPDKTALVEKQEFKGSSLLSTTRYIYGGPLLKKVQFSTGSEALEDYITYTQHDAYGNVLNYSTLAGEKNAYLWGYNSKYPVAEAKNAAHTDIFFNSFEEGGGTFTDAQGNNLALSGLRIFNQGSYTFPASFTPTDPANTVMSYWYWENEKWNFSGVVPFASTITTTGTKLDEIRAHPKGAQLSTLTYDTARGVTGTTDVNSISTHYEYDKLGRLIRIRDHKGNILKVFKYNYKN